MEKYLRQVLLFVYSMMFAVSAANAEIVRLEFSGATLEGSVGGDIEYAPGETFSGRFVFDTSESSDTAGDPNVGSFSDSPNFSTASGINFFAFSTSEGDSASFDRGQVTGPLNPTVGTIAQQIQINGVSSTVSNQLFQIRDFLAAFPGNTPIIAGTIKGLQPNLVSLDLQTSTEGGQLSIFV